MADTGIGMTEEQVSMLFTPFHQADSSTTRKYGETGLGLVISKRLSEALGDINARSVCGEGSTFTVTLKTGPLNDADLIHELTDESRPKENDESNCGITEFDCRLLLAEDGPDNQRLISFLLKRAGAQVTVAENGQVAYDLALEAKDKDEPFDVILMDMQMPVLDGYDATGKLRLDMRPDYCPHRPRHEYRPRCASRRRLQ